MRHATSKLCGVVLLVVGAYGMAHAQPMEKNGVLNIAQAVAASPWAHSLRVRVDQVQSAQQRRLAELQSQLSQQMTTYDADVANKRFSSASAMNVAAQAIQQKQKEYVQAEAEARQRVQEVQAQWEVDTQRSAVIAAATISREKNLALIYSSAGLIYSSGNVLDITAEVARRMTGVAK